MQFNFIDSIGLGGHEYQVDEIFRQIKNAIYAESKVDRILVVMRMERFRPKVQSDYKKIIDLLRTLGAAPENLAFALTYSDPWKRGIVAKYVEDLIRQYQLPLRKTEVLHLCFPKLTDIEEDFLPIYMKRVVESKERLFEFLTKSKPAPFRPLQKVLEELHRQENRGTPTKVLFFVVNNGIVPLLLLLAASMVHDFRKKRSARH